MQCNVCDAPIQRIGEKFDVTISLCIQCRSIVANCDEPSVDFYEKSYFGSHEYGYRDATISTSNINQQDAASRRRLDGIAIDGTVVEVGAGNGSFVKAGESAGMRILGVERSEYMRATAQQVFGVKLITDIPPLPDQPVAMALIEVIEHVKLPRDFLEMLFENLGKHPEKLLITTPNGSAFAIMGLKWIQIKPPEHITLFTADGLRRMLAQLGYSDLKFHYYHSLFLEYAIQTFGSRSNRKVPILWMVSSLLRYADAAVCHLLPKCFALGLECYCRK